MRKAYFCIDFEDWFHIPYLFKYNFRRDEYLAYSSLIKKFAKRMSDQGIKMTIFVVGDIAKNSAGLLRDLSEMGHEIACHSFSHLAINEMTNDEFEKDTAKAKKAIEDAVGKPIFGYRAPYFSMTEDKLSILNSMGFRYDSSYIQSASNEYYNQMDLSSFDKIESLVYERDGFYEYEIPTYNGKPLAGGGFFRAYPFFVYKRMLKKYLKENDNYLFFVHPFEVAGVVPFKGIRRLNMKDRVRFQLGRPTVQKKINRMIRYLKDEGFQFDILGNN